MSLDRDFQDYFKALDRSNNEDRCFLCRRTPSDVKAFFGFHEDGTPIDADHYGIEDVVLDPRVDIMSYKSERPICSVCQLNYDAIFMSSNGRDLLQRVLWAMEHERERLWTQDEPPPPD